MISRSLPLRVFLRPQLGWVLQLSRWEGNMKLWKNTDLTINVISFNYHKLGRKDEYPEPVLRNKANHKTACSETSAISQQPIG